MTTWPENAPGARPPAAPEARGESNRQERVFHPPRTAAFDVDTVGWEGAERRATNAVGWWTARELERSDASFQPAELPGPLCSLLREGVA